MDCGKELWDVIIGGCMNHVSKVGHPSSVVDQLQLVTQEEWPEVHDNIPCSPPPNTTGIPEKMQWF